MNDSYDWLQDLKEGDPVIVDSSGYGNTKRVLKVERTTNTQIIVSGDKYRRQDGRRMGDSGRYYRAWLLQATPEQVKLIEVMQRVSELRNKIRDVEWRNLPLATLEAVWAIIEGKK